MEIPRVQLVASPSGVSGASVSGVASVSGGASV